MNQDNVKSLAERVRIQIEYYFGDINLNKDGYLKELVQKDNGWVSVEAVKQFKRLKRMMKTSDTIDIVEALGESKLIEVSCDCKKIRRRMDKPIPPRNELISDLKKRSVAIIGFPHDVSVDQVLTFLKDFDNVPSVTMCREKNTHCFHGKVLATFEDEKAAHAFLKSPFGSSYNGKRLYRKMQLDFEEDMKSFLESEEQNCEYGPFGFGVCVQC
jgi:lupus La protein